MIEIPDPPPNRRSRLEDEVLEILTKSDRPPTPSERIRSSWTRRQRSARQTASGRSASILERMDSGFWLVVCLVLGIAAYLLADTSALLARVLAFIAFGLLIANIVRSWGRPSQRNVKQWRGRDIDISSQPRPLWIERILRNNRRPPRPPGR